MNKEFIPYEQALELKELGFDEKCFAAMDMYSNIDYGSEMYDWIKNGETVQSTWAALPLYQQAFRWFREKHGLSAQFSYYHVPKWTFEILEFTDMKITPNKVVSEHSKERTHEEAELACLKKLIEIVKNK